MAKIMEGESRPKNQAEYEEQNARVAAEIDRLTAAAALEKAQARVDELEALRARRGQK